MNPRDHASKLLRNLQGTLNAEVPLPGGWLLMRLKDPQFPFGIIDLFESDPVRGQAYYSETHSLNIAVWTRAEEGQLLHPKQALDLSERAHHLLGSMNLSTADLLVVKTTCGRLTPQNPDGVTYGRSFLATAITQEVKNG